MKKIISALSGLILLLPSMSGLSSSAINFPLKAQIQSESAVIINLDIDTIINEKNADIQQMPGALVNIMTAVVCLENCDDLDEKLIHAVASHGYGICCDVEPVHEMEKVLFAVDELTGLIGAAALMRPSKSVKDMEVKSVKKKFKDKAFAAGCNRDIIRTGAERLGWELDKLMEYTLKGMQADDRNA